MEKEMNQEPKKAKGLERKKVELVLTGEVVSSKANKTITVSVQRIFQHPIYKKIVRKRIKYLVHDEQNQCKPGDVVRIKLVRPISKWKRWLLIEVLSTAPKKVVEKNSNANTTEVS